MMMITRRRRIRGKGKWGCGRELVCDLTDWGVVGGDAGVE
jgi:hypothetical protein